MTNTIDPAVVAEMAPGRVRLSRRKGWRMPPNTVSVARPGRWGNPVRVGPRMTAAEAVAFYRRSHVPSDVSLLRGKNLACWCPLDGPCHADVLLELANQDTQPCK